MDVNRLNRIDSSIADDGFCQDDVSALVKEVRKTWQQLENCHRDIAALARQLQGVQIEIEQLTAENGLSIKYHQQPTRTC